MNGWNKLKPIRRTAGIGKGSSKSFLLKTHESFCHFDKLKTPASSFQNSKLTHRELRLWACFKESDPVSSHMNDWLRRLWDFHTITLHHWGLIYSVATATPKCVSSLPDNTQMRNGWTYHHLLTDIKTLGFMEVKSQGFGKGYLCKCQIST